MTRQRTPSRPSQVPTDATDVELSGPKPFLTRIRYRDSDGTIVEWSARGDRKTHPRSRGLTWRIGLLFAIGSTCYLLGPIPTGARQGTISHRLEYGGRSSTPDAPRNHPRCDAAS